VDQITVLTLGIASALMAADPVVVPSAPQSTASTQGQAQLDPNEVICQKQEVLGSRLGSKRVCLTRLQWAERRSEDRKDLERAQVHPDRPQ
jgi:hypothetical protein